MFIGRIKTYIHRRKIEKEHNRLKKSAYGAGREAAERLAAATEGAVITMNAFAEGMRSANEAKRRDRENDEQTS
jgi:hypothetical protein